MVRRKLIFFPRLLHANFLSGEKSKFFSYLENFKGEYVLIFKIFSTFYDSRIFFGMDKKINKCSPSNFINVKKIEFFSTVKIVMEKSVDKN